MSSAIISPIFKEIAAAIPQARLSSMFGCPCIKAPNGKAAAFLWKGQLIVKPAAEALAQMLDEGYEEFCPMEGGRPMAGWIVIPEAQAEAWPAFAIASYERVSMLPAKKR